MPDPMRVAVFFSPFLFLASYLFVSILHILLFIYIPLVHVQRIIIAILRPYLGN